MTLAPGAYAGITLNGTQINWVRQIIDAARAYQGVTDRDIVCALACAMQESNFYMYANDGTSTALGLTQQSAIRASLNIQHDKVGHDSASVGLFQQQPYIPGRTWGWGTIAQCMDVTYSTNAFLSPLLKIADRANKEVTVLVQTVQKSAFPNAYAKWEQLGWALLAAGTGPQPAPTPPPAPVPAPSPVPQPDPTPPVPAAPVWPSTMPRTHWFGLKSDRSAKSHGGFYAWERPYVKWIQQKLISLGYVPGVTDWRSDWADGIFEQPTLAAVARWQGVAAPGTQFWGAVWYDDYQRLARS